MTTYTNPALGSRVQHIPSGEWGTVIACGWHFTTVKLDNGQTIAADNDDLWAGM